MVFKKLRRLRKKKGEKSKPAAARPTPHSPTASRGTAHGFPKTKDISDLFFFWFNQSPLAHSFTAYARGRVV